MEADLLSLSGFPLFEFLADAGDDVKTVLKGESNLKKTSVDFELCDKGQTVHEIVFAPVQYKRFSQFDNVRSSSSFVFFQLYLKIHLRATLSCSLPFAIAVRNLASETQSVNIISMLKFKTPLT